MNMKRLKIDLYKLRNELFWIVCKSQVKVWKSYLKTSPIECVILSSLFKKCASLMLLQKFFHKLFAKREFFMIFFSFFAVFTILCLIAIYFRTPMFNRYFWEGLVHYITGQTYFSLWNSFSKVATLRFTQSPSIFLSFIKEVLFLLT